MEYELPEDQIPIFEAHFAKGNSIAEGLVILKGVPNPKLGFWNRRKARKAIGHYLKCLEMIPHQWQCHWLAGKLYQALAEHEKALQHFKAAIEVEHENPNLPREASISAIDAGQPDLAIKFSEEAIRRDPEDAGLYCNHKVNLMVMGHDSEAMTFIQKAIEMDPEDEINQNAYGLIEAVALGKRKRPSMDQLW